MIPEQGKKPLTVEAEAKRSGAGLGDADGPGGKPRYGQAVAGGGCMRSVAGADLESRFGAGRKPVGLAGAVQGQKQARCSAAFGSEQKPA